MWITHSTVSSNLENFLGSLNNSVTKSLDSFVWHNSAVQTVAAVASPPYNSPSLAFSLLYISEAPCPGYSAFQAFPCKLQHCFCIVQARIVYFYLVYSYFWVTSAFVFVFIDKLNVLNDKNKICITSFLIPSLLSLYILIFFLTIQCSKVGRNIPRFYSRTRVYFIIIRTNLFRWYGTLKNHYEKLNSVRIFSIATSNLSRIPQRGN